MEQAPVYSAINFSVPFARGPDEGRINLSALSTQISTFMCPSDPSPAQSQYSRWDSGIGPRAANGQSPLGPKLCYFVNAGDNTTDTVASRSPWPFSSLPRVRDNRRHEQDVPDRRVALRVVQLVLLAQPERELRVHFRPRELEDHRLRKHGVW
jgi:hypothetical protein